MGLWGKKEPSQLAKTIAEYLKKPEEWNIIAERLNRGLHHKSGIEICEDDDIWCWKRDAAKSPIEFDDADQQIIEEAENDFHARRIQNASNQFCLPIWADWLEERGFEDAAKALRERFKE